MSGRDSDSEEAKTLFRIVRELYGSHLTPRELKEVRGEVEEIVEIARALRSVKLKNSDEPLSTFKPYRRVE